VQEVRKIKVEDCHAERPLWHTGEPRKACLGMPSSKWVVVHQSATADVVRCPANDEEAHADEKDNAQDGAEEGTEDEPSLASVRCGPKI
jgi:hypothetical protein